MGRGGGAPQSHRRRSLRLDSHDKKASSEREIAEKADQKFVVTLAPYYATLAAVYAHRVGDEA